LCSSKRPGQAAFATGIARIAAAEVDFAEFSSMFRKMNSYTRIIQGTVWGCLVAVVLVISLTFLWKLRKESPVPLPVYGQVGSFSFANQSDTTTSLETLKGQVWVANVIFTRCGGPCPKLTQQMSEIQDAFESTAPVRFVSLTADPEFDTSQVLRQFAQRFGADPHRWFFLTGTKRDVYDLAIDGLKFIVRDNGAERKPNEDLFLHSMKFVVVDGQGRIRGYFDGLEETTVESIVEAVRKLLRERRTS